MAQRSDRKSGWFLCVRALLLALFVMPVSRATPVTLAEATAFANDEEIVYFDGDRVIRVLDPSPPNSALRVEWFSPSGGWGKIALGDVTGDGDVEIVAIRPEGDGGRLTIFDPVAQDSPEDQVQFIEDVPWATLYDVSLPSAPRLVAMGEFDGDSKRKEVLYSYGLPDDMDHFVILRETGAGAPGRTWEELQSWDLEGRWSAIATGNVYTDTVDEVGLVSFARGELGLFRVMPNVVRTFTNVNVDNRWTNVAFGQFTAGGGDEMGAVRDADFPLASLWVFRDNGTTMVDNYAERLSPSPNVIFFGDIGTATGGNTDDEVIVLRQVPQEIAQRFRLVVRDGTPANDTLIVREELLDGDNEYKGGDAGDIDADGRDEIVLVRNNRIRIYTEPEKSVTNQQLLRFTDGQTVKLGNLDAVGLAQRSRLFADRTSAVATLQPGQSGGTTVINVQDVTKGAALPFNVTIQGAQEWLSVTPSSTSTPAALTLTFDADGIQPGEYSGIVVIDAQPGGVANDPLTINVALTVEPVVTADPASISFYPCDEPPSAEDQEVVLTGPGVISYTAQIEGNPEWISVVPEAGTLPETVRIVTDRNLSPQNIALVDLLVTVDLPNEPGVINRIPIASVCPAARLFAPTLSD